MKRIFLKTLLLLAALAVGYFAGQHGKHDHDHAADSGAKAGGTLYTCGMHPHVIQDKPGNCPICKMKLTPIRGGSGAGAAASDPAKLFVDPAAMQRMNIRTGEAVRGPLRRVIRTVGTVEYAETGQAEVSTKFKGWIEQLHVDTTGQQVHRGEPLFEIYSPDLYNAQVEYLLALKSGNAAVRSSALTKLKFFDISDGQIAQLEKNGQAEKSLRIHSPIDGFVTDKNVVEGQMVDVGKPIFRLADLSLVWVYAQIYEQDLAFVRLGQEAAVTLSYLPDRQFRGRVTYVYPDVDRATRTARVRMEFHNPGYFLKPGMFASVQLTSELAASAVLVPDSAVLRSGRQDTVFVGEGDGHFEPRPVKVGHSAEDGMIEILDGLVEGESVVLSGQFMLDSESQLREAIRKMPRPATGEPAQPEAAAGHGHTLAKPDNEPGGSVWLCPMPEHVAIRYNHAGKCDICNMALVPMGEAALARLRPGGKLLHYTCPMPEDADIQLASPGKCPKCSMTLIPVMEPPPPVPVAKRLYTCPMSSHKHIVSDHPGDCPECNMKLVDTRTVKHGPASKALWEKQQAGKAQTQPGK
ncbi:MAG: hypothetical protein CMO43_11105 [Verrucomicrobiales bacterium]|nr:hypothetical protein [Verrucomicrobiales bacterium]